MLKQLLAGAALLLALPASADAAIFNPAVKTLDNGLEIVVVENHRAPVALHMLWYRAGSADEDPQHGGLAHYLEHMMFKGTKAEPDQDFSSAVAALGGTDNAFTSYDYTAYFQKVPPEQLATVMQMEAERMTGLLMDETKFTVEKSVIQQERGERNESTPEARFGLVLQAALYQGHPYARPVIGTQSSIAGLTRDALYAYYKQHYMPANATLIVVGDVIPADVFAKAEAAYGAIPAQSVAQPAPTRPRAPVTSSKPQRITVAEQNVRQPLLALAWRVPSYAEPGSLNPYALAILADLMSLPESGLQQQLVYRQPIAVGLSASYDGDKLNTGDFTLTLSPRPGTSLDKAEAALETALAILQKTGITDDQLARAKRRAIEQTELARDALTSAAYIFGTARTTGQSIAEVEAWPDRVQAVTLAEMNAALAALKLPAHVTAKLVGQKARKK